jgi:hypothetical protein
MSRYSLIFTLIAAAFLWGCKGSTTGPGNGGTTPASIGDSIPVLNTQYDLGNALTDSAGSILLSSINTFGFHAIVQHTGLSYQGKDNVYFIMDEQDSVYCAYESNGDVSFYYQTPDYYQIYGNPQTNVNEPLEDILNIAFHQWITLPVASKKTGVNIYHGTPRISISGDSVKTNIDVTVGYLGDSIVTTFNSHKSVTAKLCRITITGIMDFGPDGTRTLTHYRDIWFVPNMGYYAQLKTQTNMQEYKLLLVPHDTTGRFRALL